MIIIIYKDNKYTRNDNMFIDLVVGSPGICIGNRMNASAFRDIWARVMFFKFSKLHEPQASAI